MNVPLRSKLFLWRMLYDILRVRINLEKRGVPINPLCPQCWFAKEPNFHAIFGCEGIFILWFLSSLGLIFESRNSHDLGDWLDGL